MHVGQSCSITLFGDLLKPIFYLPGVIAQLCTDSHPSSLGGMATASHEQHQNPDWASRTGQSFFLSRRKAFCRRLGLYLDFLGQGRVDVLFHNL